MKNQLLIGAALAGMLYLQSDFVWAANPPQPDQDNARIHDQQQIPGGQSAKNQNENDDKVRAANTVKVQGPAPVILQIRLVDKTAD